MNPIILAIIIVAAIGLIAGVGLSIAAMVLAVPVDERVAKVRECLPGANCGACGFSGCDGYANAIVEDGAALNLCSPGGSDTASAIAGIMGGEAEEISKKTAVVLCNGNNDNCGKKYDYNGVPTCAAVSALNAGDKNCPYSCLGYGDCARACPFNAITICNGVAVIDSEKCTACGACIKTCPRNVIDMMPANKRKAVTLCSNQEMGAVSRKQCSVSCIACRLCEKACKFDAIHVVDNRSVVDMEKCVGCGACVKVCPTKCLFLRK